MLGLIKTRVLVGVCLWLLLCMRQQAAKRAPLRANNSLSLFCMWTTATTGYTSTYAVVQGETHEERYRDGDGDRGRDRDEGRDIHVYQTSKQSSSL